MKVNKFPPEIMPVPGPSERDNHLTFFENSKQEWLTTEEAAEYLRIDPKSLLNHVSNGSIRYYKLFGRNRYRLEDLRNLLIEKRRI